jgi:hypothetical protein
LVKKLSYVRFFEDIKWFHDPAASGPRLRAWIESSKGEHAELVAYLDGAWALGFPKRQYPYVAQGKEADVESAQKRVFRVWKAMRL